MKKKISIINYILVIMLAVIGVFRIYIANSNMESKNILGDSSIESEYISAGFLIMPLVLQILRKVSKTTEIGIKKKKQDCTWNPIISITFLFMSIFPILLSFDSDNSLVRRSGIIVMLIQVVLFFTSYLWLYYEVLNRRNNKKEALKRVKKSVKITAIFFLVIALIVVIAIMIFKINELKIKN